MGNCETNQPIVQDPQFQQYGGPIRSWNPTYKSEFVEVHANVALVEEQEEGGLVLLGEECQDQDYVKMKINCDTVQTSIGIGIVDFEKVNKTDFSGQTNYGLDHGMWMVYSDKQVAASNDPDMDKKMLGIEVKSGDVIELTRKGQVFSIKKAGDNKQITFKLDADANRKYYFASYLYSGWDSTEAKVAEAKIEIL